MSTAREPADVCDDVRLAITSLVPTMVELAGIDIRERGDPGGPQVPGDEPWH